MPRDGNGTFTRPVASYVSNTVISSTAVNSEMDGIATGLTNSIAKDGQTNPTANLPMATYRHTGVGNASARTDYAATGQVQDGSFLWGGTAGGTADALTITLTPAITAYAAGQEFRFVASANNTGAATLAVNGLAATSIEFGGAALISGVIQSGGVYSVIYDGTVFNLSAVFAAGANVSGPATATDNAWARFDGTTGKIIQNGTWVEDDTGAVTAGGSLDMDGNALTVDGATFNQGGEVKYLAAGSVTTDRSYDETTERDISLTLGADLNIDFETPNSGMGYSHVLWITQDGTGGRTPTIRNGSNTAATWLGTEPAWSGLAASALTIVSVLYAPSGTLYAVEVTQ